MADSFVPWVDFLNPVDGWIPPQVARVCAINNNLKVNWATDVLLFWLANPR